LRRRARRRGRADDGGRACRCRAGAVGGDPAPREARSMMPFSMASNRETAVGAGAGSRGARPGGDAGSRAGWAEPGSIDKTQAASHGAGHSRPVNSGVLVEARRRWAFRASAASTPIGELGDEVAERQPLVAETARRSPCSGRPGGAGRRSRDAAGPFRPRASRAGGCLVTARFFGVCRDHSMNPVGLAHQRPPPTMVADGPPARDAARGPADARCSRWQTLTEPRGPVLPVVEDAAAGAGST